MVDIIKVNFISGRALCLLLKDDDAEHENSSFCCGEETEKHEKGEKSPEFLHLGTNGR